MSWLLWALIYVAGIIALAIVGTIWQSRRQRIHLRTRFHKGVLHFDAIDGGAGTIPTADIVEVVNVSSEMTGAAIEIVSCNASRFRLQPKDLIYFGILKDAFQRSNPAIRSSSRENCCHQCGADLRVPRDTCPYCKEPVPQVVGRI